MCEHMPSWLCFSWLVGNECKLCFQSCATCNGVGDAAYNNCLTCKSAFGFQGQNCEAFKSNWYIDVRNYKVCTSPDTSFCPNTHPYLLFTTKECIKDSCADHMLLEYEQYCVATCPSYYKTEGGKCVPIILPPIQIDKTKIVIDEPLNNFLNQFEDNIHNYYTIANQIVGDDFTIQMINSTLNPITKLGDTNINLLNCEDILRDSYELSNDESLVIVLIDLFTKKLLISQVEYAVYDQNFSKLDLSLCADVKIKVTSPIRNYSELNLTKGEEMQQKGIDIFNATDPCFNDICFPYQENDTDMIIADRRTDLYVNASFCDDGCLYNGINYTLMTVECICTPKKTIQPTLIH